MVPYALSEATIVLKFDHYTLNVYSLSYSIIVIVQAGLWE